MRSPSLPPPSRGDRRAEHGCDGDVAAFAGHDGTALARAIEELIDSPSAAGLSVARDDYAELFHATIGDRVVRRPETRDVRAHIYGPLEARLQTVDRLVLGGLNEGTWPPETRSDPWLSRPMRRELGLDPPERRIGLSAHDFAQSLGAREAILSRAAKVAGAPTVASRFVQRIAALAGGRWPQVVRARRALSDAGARARCTGGGEARDAAGTQAAARGAARAGCRSRPSRTGCAIPTPSTPNTFCACACSIRSTRRRARATAAPSSTAPSAITPNCSPTSAPADPLKELLKLGEKHFAPLADYPEARAFWWPRYQRIARWFAGWDLERRQGLAALHAEIKGELSFPMGARQFTLTGIADRIERRSDGTLRHHRLQDRARRAPKSRCAPGWRRN